MAKYVLAADLYDPSLVISESHTLAADVFVDMALQTAGINPGDVTLPNAMLTEIASNWAKRVAAIEGAIGENSPLIAKAREFEKNATMLAEKLSRSALGISTATTAGYSSFKIGRA